MRIAYGELGMTENEFKRCSPEYFTLKLQGKRYADKMDYRNDWERFRWLATRLLQVHTKRILRDQDLMRFSWEAAENVDWGIVDKATPKTIPNGVLNFKKPLRIASFGNSEEIAEA